MKDYPDRMTPEQARRFSGDVLNMEAWTEGRMILSDEQKAALKDQVEAFLKFV